MTCPSGQCWFAVAMAVAVRVALELLLVAVDVDPFAGRWLRRPRFETSRSSQSEDQCSAVQAVWVTFQFRFTFDNFLLQGVHSVAFCTYY